MNGLMSLDANIKLSSFQQNPFVVKHKNTQHFYPSHYVFPLALPEILNKSVTFAAID